MTVREQIDEYADEQEVPLRVFDGFDDAILGIAYRSGSEPIVAYDRLRCIEKLIKDGMTEEQAEEYFEFNVVGAYIGGFTPIFVDLM